MLRLASLLCSLLAMVICVAAVIYITLAGVR